MYLYILVWKIWEWIERLFNVSNNKIRCCHISAMSFCEWTENRFVFAQVNIFSSKCALRLRNKYKCDLQKITSSCLFMWNAKLCDLKIFFVSVRNLVPVRDPVLFCELCDLLVDYLQNWPRPFFAHLKLSSLYLNTGLLQIFSSNIISSNKKWTIIKVYMFVLYTQQHAKIFCTKI